MNLEVRYDAPTCTFRILVPGKVQIPAINDWPGWRRHASGQYMAPAWPSSILAMTKTAHSLQWDEQATRKRDEILSNLQLARNALKQDDRTFSQLKREPTERVARLHQRQAVNAMRHMGWRVLLADDMGLGKTSEALWAAHDAGVKRLLVICPVSVKFNWQSEITTTLGHGWHCYVIDGNSKQRAMQMIDAVRQPMGEIVTGKAIIINYDLLRHMTADQLERLQGFVSEASGEGMLLLDESHYLKSRDSERTTLCTKIAQRSPYVIAMTGTPIRNLADDLYPQVEIVRPGTWTSFRDFAKRHLVIQAVKFGKRDVQKIVGVRNLDALNAVMNTLQIKRAKSEVLDLPAKTYTFPELQLEGPLLRVYKAMKDFARIQLRDLMKPANVDSLTSKHGVPLEKSNDQAPRAMTVFDPRARSAVEQAMRCEQIANGFIGGIPQPVMDSVGPDILELAVKIEGRPNELMFPTHPKVVWMRETIESILKQGGAPLVGCRFNAPLVWLRSLLRAEGVKVGLLYGELSAGERQEVLQGFADRRIDVLLSQVKIAEGWNATRSQDVIHWTRDWSPAINAQFEDRAHRMGQTGTVNVQIPIVRKTIELMIHKRLTQKGADADQALRTVTIEELMEAL